jgi:hypothetical protein
MPVLMIFAHEVKDWDTWKSHYDANLPLRKEAGLVDFFVGRDAKKPNVVHVGVKAPSLEAAHKFMAKPELLDAMAAAGVASAPDIRLILVD